jgi:hypothetical protein
MARIFMVIVGLFYYGIVRGRKLSFEGRLNFWKWTTKKQGASFSWNGSPFDLKISDFWRVLYPLPSLLDSNLEGRVHWASRLRDIMTSFRLADFFAFSPPRFLKLWVFCPIR